ncbi:peptidoglycan DD-metalloendopeptidase family protein [Ralstonia sp. SET104]|uniref:peptidoglycan DD-metalloendopeptidase family protein n=1 Tax=Ralstonia sp. SET104 TaxID=2448774 RepID=UPI000F584F1F|nr:peptidoglycan DD-metalloendopeptidase family protein [Ralstonia sp. SET104]GCB03044.1 peptidase [Ralstonia sp. SET104]
MFTPRSSMNRPSPARAGRLAVAMVSAALLAACASSGNQAPVLDRTSRGGSTGAASQEPSPPGYYRVKRGDTLYSIALRNGQAPRDLVAWNNIANPNQIEVDQLLRVVPPNADVSSSGAVVTPVRPGNTSTQPVDSTPATPPAASSGAPAGATDSAVSLAWPAHGSLINRFDDKSNKGIDIGGKRGDAVVAADDGKVIHVGPLRGYGNLVIIKHNDTFLTAYGNNDKVLVTEQSTVKKGQKIAEMGSTDADRVKLHFEVRRNGKPVDPMRYLPPQ